eukprot:2830743-Rhodomonas_salina.1
MGERREERERGAERGRESAGGRERGEGERGGREEEREGEGSTVCGSCSRAYQPQRYQPPAPERPLPISPGTLHTLPGTLSYIPIGLTPGTVEYHAR